MSRYIEVEVDLEEFTNEELIEELESRGMRVSSTEAEFLSAAGYLSRVPAEFGRPSLQEVMNAPSIGSRAVASAIAASKRC